MAYFGKENFTKYSPLKPLIRIQNKFAVMVTRVTKFNKNSGQKLAPSNNMVTRTCGDFLLCTYTTSYKQILLWNQWSALKTIVQK